MCSPARTLIGPGASASVSAFAAASAPGAVGKATKEGVALRVHLYTALGRASLTNNAPVLGERVRVSRYAEFVQQPRRALDVGEEEGDRPSREVVSHAVIIRP